MRICKIDNCESKYYALGYCNKHYTRFRKYGDPLKTHPKYEHDDLCKVNGCNNKYYGLGYCSKHWMRFKNHDDPYHKKYTHGMTGSPEYITWASMKTRCYNKNAGNYKYYGGREITVCERWHNSFEAFHKDMGPRPFPEAELDRINNDGNYEPGNCRWITHEENIRKSSFLKRATK